MAYIVNWESKGVCVHFNDEFSLDINTMANNEIYENPRIDDVKYIVWDFTDVKNYTMSESDVRKPAAIDKGASYYLNKIKMLMVVKDDYGKKLCHEYIQVSQSLETAWDFYLFDNMEQLRSYLAKADL